MPPYICRFCNKSFRSRCFYYTHLHNYIDKLSEEEKVLSELYHTRRKNIKQKSYYNMKGRLREGIIDYRHNCKLCDFKTYYMNTLEVHLVGKHTINELLEGEYNKEYIDYLVDRKYKRKVYQTHYLKNIKYGPTEIIEPTLPTQSTEPTQEILPIALPKPNIQSLEMPINNKIPVPKIPVPPLIQIFNLVPVLIPIQYINNFNEQLN